MYTKAINGQTQRLLATLAGKKIISDFYLAGGTALALQLGHRLSIDLDWFSPKEFLTSNLKNKIKNIGATKIFGEAPQTLHLSLKGVRISFLHYPYRLLFPEINFYGSCLANWRDIACMKLDAVFSRGSKKDFIDLYFILKQTSLEKLLADFDKKYKVLQYSKLHLLKSLVYFDDAEDEPMPVMLKKVSWPKIKQEISYLVKNYLK